MKTRVKMFLHKGVNIEDFKPYMFLSEKGSLYAGLYCTAVESTNFQAGNDKDIIALLYLSLTCNLIKSDFSVPNVVFIYEEMYL